jgi:PAS domain-containing protein
MEDSNYIDGLLKEAVAARAVGEKALFSALDRIPAPIYVTDAEGLVRHFNPWCYAFAGRAPAAGKDRWCVTWKLYTCDGEFLPHDRCPMAEAIRQSRPIRGVTALAERPDGTRVTFMPFPTPIFSASGKLEGAINMLVDITEPRQAQDLHEQAARCSRLSIQIGDEQASEALALMAVQYTIKATALQMKEAALESRAENHAIIA